MLMLLSKYIYIYGKKKTLLTMNPKCAPYPGTYAPGLCLCNKIPSVISQLSSSLCVNHKQTMETINTNLCIETYRGP